MRRAAAPAAAAVAAAAAAWPLRLLALEGAAFFLFFHVFHY
jgi:hypothetical protein